MQVEAQEKPSKKSKKGGANGSVALMKEFIQGGCVSQELYPRKSFLREKKIGTKSRRQILTGHVAPKKNLQSNEKVDSGALMYMLSRRDLSLEELETLRRSRNPQRW